LHGYYGGIRLIKATIKRFADYCSEHNLILHDQNFSVRYETNIPRQVGLAGSSSIIVATLRCLMEFYEIEIPLELQPSFVLSIETEELGISAGLQDRVIQCYEGVVYMNFDKLAEREANRITFYAYERLEPALLPPLFIAYHNALSEPTETFHNDIRGRYDCGESLVVNAMQHFAGLTVRGRDALLNADAATLSELINENFDTRRSIYQLPSWQVKMVDMARCCGASAKFAGSGGAVIGIYQGEAMFNEIRDRMAEIGSITIKPIVTE
jgi:glucuronokinase